MRRSLLYVRTRRGCRCTRDASSRSLLGAQSRRGFKLAVIERRGRAITGKPISTVFGGASSFERGAVSER